MHSCTVRSFLAAYLPPHSSTSIALGRCWFPAGLVCATGPEKVRPPREGPLFDRVPVPTLSSWPAPTNVCICPVVIRTTYERRAGPTSVGGRESRRSGCVWTDDCRVRPPPASARAEVHGSLVARRSRVVPTAPPPARPFRRLLASIQNHGLEARRQCSPRLWRSARLVVHGAQQRRPALCSSKTTCPSRSKSDASERYISARPSTWPSPSPSRRHESRCAVR